MINHVTTMQVSHTVKQIAYHPVGFVYVTFHHDKDGCRIYNNPTGSSMRRVIRAQARHMYAVLMNGKTSEAKS